MKRLIALALASTLVVAPAVLAQTKPATSPAPTGAQPDKSKPTTPPLPPKVTEKPKEPPPKPEMSKEMEDAAKPGSNHKLLEWFEGEWDAVVTTPGQDKPDRGTMTCKMVFGGRFLTMDFDGRSRGKFFRGGGMWGYNNHEKRFEQTWADSESTGINFMTGKAGPDGKTFVLTGDGRDPMTGRKTTMRWITTITGKDTWKDELYANDPSGKEVLAMTITYAKAKGEKAADKQTEKPADKPTEKPKK